MTTTHTATPIVHVEAGESFIVECYDGCLTVVTGYGAAWAAHTATPDADGIILDSSAGAADAQPLFLGMKEGDAFVAQARSAEAGGGWTVNLVGAVASSGSTRLHLHFR